MPIYEDEIRKDSINNDSGVISNDTNEHESEAIDAATDAAEKGDAGYTDPELDTEDTLDLSELKSKENRKQKLRVAAAFRHLLKVMC